MPTKPTKCPADRWRRPRRDAWRTDVYAVRCRVGRRCDGQARCPRIVAGRNASCHRRLPVSELSARRNSVFAVFLVVVLAAAAGAGGYSIASSGGEDLDAARDRGAQAGQQEGRERGRRRGNAAGRAAGEKAAYRTAFRKSSKRRYRIELAAAERREAVAAHQAAIAQQAATAQEAAQRAEATERAENCGAPLFVSGYCPTDEEIEREQSAESLCGPGTEQGRREAAELGIQC